MHCVETLNFGAMVRLHCLIFCNMAFGGGGGGRGLPPYMALTGMCGTIGYCFQDKLRCFFYRSLITSCQLLVGFLD